MNRLNIFVSSTCFDLSQIRTDIYQSLIENGHTPILSEFENFPINPSKKTAENCINAVKNEADVFLLIIGNRYGSILETGKSITNTEFLTAREKGIPVFIFVDKKTINALNFWKNNKDADFSSFVDNTQIFEFVESIRDNEKLWMFDYEKAQDIIVTFKIQLSYLFKESLKLKTRFDSNYKDELIKLNISDQALSILLKKEKMYEYFFLAQTLIDEIEKKESLKNDYDYKIFLNVKDHLKDEMEIFDWISNQLSALITLVTSIEPLFTEAFPKYIAEDGVPSDIKGLYYLSQTYSKIFESVVKWTIETMSTNVPNNCINARNKLAKISTTTIEEIWDYPFRFMAQLENIKLALEKNEPYDKISLVSIKIGEKDIAEYYEEIQKLGEEIKQKKSL